MKKKDSITSRTSSLTKDGILNVSESAGVTIHQIAKTGEVDLLEKLLDRFPNPQLRKKKANSKDDLKLTPLHYAARYYYLHAMSFLIENGANVDAKDEDGSTPLHFIAKYKRKIEKDGTKASSNDEDEEEIDDDSSNKCLQLLINQGANINASDEAGYCPLHLACLRKNTGVVRELLRFPQLNLEATDQQGMTALHIACCNGNLKIAKILLEKGANLRSRDKTMATPFHLSCVDGNLELAKYLLDEADMEAELYSKNQTSTLMTVDENRKKGNENNPESEIVDQKNKLDKSRKSSESSLLKRGIDSSKKNLLNNKANKKISASNLPRKSTDSGISMWRRIIHRTPRNSVPSSQNQFEMKINPSHAFDTNFVQEVTRGALDLLQDTDAEKNLGFHLAIENGHFALVQLCLERAKKASWDYITHARRSFDDSCLHLAVQSNNLEIIELLLKNGIDVNARNASLVTPLMLSCQQNAYQIVKYLVTNGADVELKDSDNMTPLMISCRYGHVETVTCLLEFGANVAAIDKDDKTCLMYAAEENRTEVVMMLLQTDAAKNLVEEKNKYNNTALHLASMRGHNEMVKLLLDQRASTLIKNNDDRTTLHMAALHGHDVVIPALVNKDRSILNSGDDESNTALHLAAIGGNLKSVTSLVQSGANLEIRNVHQWTPLDCAAAFGWEKIVSILLESGANIQPKKIGKKHSTNTIAPLHLACQRGHVNVVKILLEWKADVTFKSSDGRNALDFAIDFGQKECVLALIKHETWQLSMKNATFNPVTGRMVTPMRKLIMKMGDMAMIVCNQSITDNGKKPENDDYAVTFLYEYLDDMYSSTEWSEKLYLEAKEKNLSEGNEEYTVFDEDDIITQQATTYSSDSDMLQSNHPLQTMVDCQSESLLLHPLVTGLLNYKWRRYGRYIYYANLILYVAYMLLLNIYMLLVPLSYKLNWFKIIKFRQYLDQNRSAAGLNLTQSVLFDFETASSACFFYRKDVTLDIKTMITTTSCQIFLGRNLQTAVFVYSIFNLLRAMIQFLSQKLSYITFKTVFELALYVMSLLLTIDFPFYQLNNIRQLVGIDLAEQLEVKPIKNFQQETGLRLEWQEQIGAFGIFLSWMVLLLYIQMIPKIGIFVVMFTGVLKTFIEFFIIFVFFILAFTLSFSILLGNQHEFETWYEALVKTTVMTIGELDFGDMFFSASDSFLEIGKDYHAQVFSRQVSLILFTIFLLIMTILIMNLLVGLAVGDIIEIRRNATLESLGMQIALVLEVEFTMPIFLRKKISKRKQRLEINKYRNANFIKQLLFHDSNLSLTDIAAAVDKEEGEQEDVRTTEDKVMVGLNLLRGRLSDMMAEQADLIEGVRGVKTLVFETKLDSKEHAKNIQKNISETSSELEQRIEQTRFGLTETTHSESTVTRGKVDGTLLLVNAMKEEMEFTKRGMAEIKAGLEDKILQLQAEILSRDWWGMQKVVNQCEQDIKESKKEIVESLEEIKFILLKGKLMSSI